MDISIIGHGCQVTFDEPMLAIAWLREMVGQLQPGSFMSVYKAIYGVATPKEIADVAKMATECFGTGV